MCTGYDKDLKKIGGGEHPETDHDITPAGALEST